MSTDDEHEDVHERESERIDFDNRVMWQRSRKSGRPISEMHVKPYASAPPHACSPEWR